MANHSDVHLTGRERRRLQLARENGYLDATCSDNSRVVKLHGLWCWRLKVPMVWCERRSPRSRYGRVRLDMLTTPNMLTAGGQAAMKALGPAKTSPHDVTWDSVPVASLAKLGNAALRAAVRVENYKLNRSQLVKIDARSKKLLRVVSSEAASA